MDNTSVELAIAEVNGKMDSTLEKLRASWGRGEKRTAREQQALIFGRKLAECGGTFEFTDAHRKLDLGNIWEAMAFDLHEPSKTMREKFDSLEEWTPIYKHGCVAFSNALQEEWDDQIILCVPTVINGGRIDFVTWNRNLVVNPRGAEGERTALEVWALRGEKRVTGQISSVAKKMIRTAGRDATLTTISRIATKAVDGLPAMLKNGTREKIEN